MTTRPAVPSDRHDSIPWLCADDPDSRRRVMVEEVDGCLVAAARRVPNPLHPNRDFLQLTVVGEATVQILDAVLEAEPRPLIMRGLPGTPEHALATTAGATVFERVPAARITPDHPDVKSWVNEHQGQARSAHEYTMSDLADLWIDLYVAGHQHFGITTDQDVLVSRLGSFVREALTRDLSAIVEVDGRPVAGAFAFREGENVMAVVDAIIPHHPAARRSVGVAMAALLDAAHEGPLELDGHESSLHYPAVLATIPHVTSGPLTPMELLVLSRDSH